MNYTFCELYNKYIILSKYEQDAHFIQIASCLRAFPLLRKLQVRENEISLRNSSGGPESLRPLEQWFLTGGARTPWGYQTPKQGVRSTNVFRHTRPENFNDALSIVVSAVNFVRGQTLNHGLFRVFL